VRELPRTPIVQFTHDTPLEQPYEARAAVHRAAGTREQSVLSSRGAAHRGVPRAAHELPPSLRADETCDETG